MQVIFTAWFALSAITLSSTSTHYTVVDLGALPGGGQAWALDLNDAGQVAMAAQYDEDRRFYHAALWEGGALTDLGQLPSSGFHSYASAINRSGHVVGSSHAQGGFGAPRSRAFLHDGTGMADLGTLEGVGKSFASDINDRGDVVGFSSTNVIFNGQRISRAVLWTGGNILDLGTLGGLYSHANALNRSNQVVGASLIVDGPYHAFVWTPQSGVMVDLGTLGGLSSEAHDISHVGQIVGYALNPGGARRAFLFENGNMQDLGALPGARASEAFGINNANQIVGTSWVSGSGPRATLWVGGAPIDLNGRIGVTSWRLQVARAINASGWIVGYGRLDGATRAFLLKPN